jgi:hypothetical protein
MAQRCAFDGSAITSQHFKSVSGFLLHVGDDGSPVDPAHEAIEGRMLKRRGGGWKLATVISFVSPPADVLDEDSE